MTTQGTQDIAQARKPFAPFILYLVAFFAAWIAWVLFVYPRILMLGEKTLLYAVSNICIRLLVWVLPVFIYLRYVDRVEPVAFLKLGQSWKRGILIGLALTAVNLLGSILRYGLPHPTIQAVTWNSVLSTSLLIGFVEEIPFRGFILQKLEERFTFWLANLISSLLFLGIHLPGWISLHILNSAPVVFVFVFGFVLALVFKYSKSLWAPIVTHSLNDFLASIIFHV